VELRHIASFLVLAEELHFGRAAARLHLAQPSLSQQLQRLERRVGVRLVVRTSHRVWLTPAGEALQREARRLLNQLDVAVEAARRSSAGLGELLYPARVQSGDRGSAAQSQGRPGGFRIRTVSQSH
jgi:DNA-binding transcriptional LysR family regulator